MRQATDDKSSTPFCPCHLGNISTITYAQMNSQLLFDSLQVMPPSYLEEFDKKVFWHRKNSVHHWTHRWWQLYSQI
jgi:hypothetical protein